MFNKVILAGRLVRDPEPRQASTGEVMSLFTLAVDRGYKDEGADFFDCVAFGNTADYILSYVRKGYLVLVEGSLQINKWADRDGVKHSKPEIIANVVRNFEKKKENAEEYTEKEGKSTKTEEEEKESEILDEEFEKLLNEEFPNE